MYYFSININSQITLNELDKFNFDAKVYLFPYEMSLCEEREGVLMREDLFGALNCTAVKVILNDTKLVSVEAKQQGHETIEHQLNFSQWFSFYQRQDGLIRSVIYLQLYLHLFCCF